MSESDRIVDELTRAIDGDPWPRMEPRRGGLGGRPRSVAEAHHDDSGFDVTRPAGADSRCADRSGVNHYVLLHRLAQHHAYHGGQIALLKKML